MPRSSRTRRLSRDHSAQIHDAYCLRAIKSGWTDATKRQLWGWYEAASRWEGGFSFLGYLDYMIQELVGQLEGPERDVLLAEGEKYPFPTRVLVRELDLEKEPGLLPPLVCPLRARAGESSGGRTGRRPSLVDPGEAGPELSSRSPRCAARACRLWTPRDTISSPVRWPTIRPRPTCRSWWPRWRSHDRNTTNLVTAALLKLKASPQGPEALAHLIRLSRRAGPSSRPVLDELAARWTGSPKPAASTSFDKVLAAWEDVYRKQFPIAPPLGGTEAPGAHTYDLVQLIDNVLRGDVMKTASAKRGQQVIAKARCLDCHKFGDQGAGLGPELTTVNSRFRPAEILESIVLPSKVVSDQYRSVTVATQDGKLYSGMPIVTDPMNLVLAPFRRHEGDHPQERDRGAEGLGHVGDARWPPEPAELPGDRRSAGPVRLDAPGRGARECRCDGEVTEWPASRDIVERNPFRPRFVTMQIS